MKHILLFLFLILPFFVISTVAMVVGYFFGWIVFGFKAGMGFAFILIKQFKSEKE